VNLRLHAFAAASRANGPGLRAVVWFQGCTLACPGCFNPATHDPHAGHDADTVELAATIRAAAVDGLTLSGGEPLQQPEALLDLLQRLDGAPLSRLLFTGYPLAAVRRIPLGSAILARLDVVIAGPYVAARHLGRALLASANQKIHLLTPRHTAADFATVPSTEVLLHPDGTLTLSGIRPLTPAPRRD